MIGGIELVVLDMAGTTVRDDGLVEQAFDGALRESGVVPGTADYDQAHRYVRETMGQSKVEVFRALFPGQDDRARRGNTLFERGYDHLAAQRCGPVDGAEEVVRLLRDSGIRTCLTTGFAAATRERVIERLQWSNMVDLVLGSEEAGRGRPCPDMILTAGLRLGVSDVRAIAVVGDTGYDMLAGVRAGASVVAGVLTGAHDRRTLSGHGATHVLESVADLPGVLERGVRDRAG